MDLHTPSSTVILKEMSDGAVLYCTRNEIYFGLNEVGLAIWQSLALENSTVDGVVATLTTRFPGVPASRIREDAVEFLRELEQNGLVNPSERSVPAR